MSYFQQHYFHKIGQIAPQPQWNSRGDPIQYQLTLGDNWTADAGILWSLTLPQQYSQYSENQLIIRKGQIIITSVAAGYPATIYIGADSMSGYLDKWGSTTNNLAAFNLSRVTNLVYRNQADIQWPLPSNLQTLNLRMWFDDNGNSQTTPLGYHFPLKLDITRTPERKQLKMIEQFSEMIFN